MRQISAKSEKKLFHFPNPFSDICYAYDGLVSTVLPDVPRASGFFLPPFGQLAHIAIHRTEKKIRVFAAKLVLDEAAH